MDLSKFSLEQLQELQVQIEAEIESRDSETLELEEIDDCESYDDLTEDEQAEFDIEFRKQYPSVLGIAAIEQIIAESKV